MIGQFLDRHPVDAGTSRILSNTLQRGLKVLAFAHLLHQVARSQALVSTANRRRFHTQARPLRFHRAGRLCARGFRLLWHNFVEARGRLALPSVRPFARLRQGFGAATMASADFSRRWSRDPRRPFRRKARSPRVRTSAFAARPPDLRCCALVTRASRLLARSPCQPASYPVSLRRPAASLPASFTPPSRSTLCVRFARCDNSREDFTSKSMPMPGAKRKSPACCRAPRDIYPLPAA